MDPFWIAFAGVGAAAGIVRSKSGEQGGAALKGAAIGTLLYFGIVALAGAGAVGYTGYQIYKSSGSDDAHKKIELETPKQNPFFDKWVNTLNPWSQNKS